MTEAEWVSCTDPQPMLEHLRDRAGVRKFRLFALGCARRAGKAGRRPARHVLWVAERFADGLTRGPEREEAARWARRARDPVCNVALFALLRRPQDAVRAALLAVAANRGDDQAERAARCRLIRCVFGNPFRPPPALAPEVLAWDGGAVVNLARQAYEERQLPSGELDPVRLAVLADALEEAGCADDTILGHLRGPGPHARGCWVLDRLLGKD